MVRKTSFQVYNCKVSNKVNIWHCKFSNRERAYFSLAEILTNLKRCWLQSKNLKKHIFVNKNQSNDLRVVCKEAFHLVEFIEKENNFEEELEEFERKCEREEIENYER